MKGKEHHCCHCGGHKHEHKHGSSCCYGHDHGGEESGGLPIAVKLWVSFIALIASFTIGFGGFDFPFFPYSDPAWVAVLLCSGWIFKSAFVSAVYEKRITASMLVSVAMLASFMLQILEALGITAHGSHEHSYIFVVGEIAFLMTLGEWLEDRTIAKTKRGLERLTNLMPKIAKVRRDDAVGEIEASAIAAGDVVCVNPFEMIPADGEIVKGTTSVNQANMTGESAPVEKAEGDSVLCGTFNQNGYIEIRASKPSSQTALAKMIELVEEAEGKKSPIAQTAEKWASYIVPTAMALSVLTFALAYCVLGTGFSEAIVRATTILVVFCPCAFVLATPTAISAGIGRLAKDGVLVKSGEALETFAKVDSVFFDKTGTLTTGNVSVEKIETLSDFSSGEIARLAAGLERASNHPLAAAVVKYADNAAAEDGGNKPLAENVKMLTGFGMEGDVDGRKVRIAKSGKLAAEKFTASDVFVDGALAGRIFFADELRASAKAAVEELQKLGCNTAILSGDNANAVADTAQKAGIEKFRADALPKDKMDFIESAKAGGAVVCMVGDGVNDSPSLAAADVSVAIADLKSDIAVDTAQIALLDADLGKIAFLKKFAKKVVGTIRLNIAFSICINIASVLLAMTGVITPAIGALIHNFSSVAVVGNSARLLKGGGRK